MKNFFLFIFLILSFSSYSQTVKVNNLTLVTYENESNNVKIISHTTIDKKGKMKVYLDDYKGASYYSYQLNKSEIIKLNKLFDKNLQNFISKKKLDENVHYAGSRNFISFNYYKVLEKLCFIEPFMDSEFNEILNMLQDKIYKQSESSKIKKFEINFKSLENSIHFQEKIDDYLPQKELPPPPMR